MLVLILMSFVAVVAGVPKSCDEYCSSLLSGEINNTWSTICICHNRSEELDNLSQNFDNNPIYYEPVEFRPAPKVSFVYQPFVISNPKLNNKATNEIKQEHEHHRKYKRKNDVIHKIQINTDRRPVYLDIDIKNSPIQSRSSHITEHNDFQLTERDLKDCFDLHLLVHFKRNESAEIPDPEYLKKYFHLSDEDLMNEINKKCINTSNVVNQSLHRIKGKSIRINTLDRMESEKTNTNFDNDMFGSSSSIMPKIVPKIDSFHNNEAGRLTPNLNNERKINSSRYSHNNNRTENGLFAMSRLNHGSDISTVLPILLQINNDETKNKVQVEGQMRNITNEKVDDNSTEINISYRAATKRLKSKVSLLNTTASKEDNVTTIIEQTPNSFPGDYEGTNDKNQLNDGIANTNDLTIIPAENKPRYTVLYSKSNELVTDLRSEDVSSDTSLTVTNPFESILSNGFDIATTSGNMKYSETVTETSALGQLISGDQEQSTNNVNAVIKKSTGYELSSNTHYALNESTKESNLKETILRSADINVSVSPTPYIVSTSAASTVDRSNNKETYMNLITMSENEDQEHTTNNVNAIIKNTTGYELSSNTDYAIKESNLNETIIRSADTNVTVSSTPYIASTSATSTVDRSNNKETYMNRITMSENEIQIPRLIVSEYSNNTVRSTIDGNEELPNDDDLATNFELDVADLATSRVKSETKQDKDKQTHIILANNQKEVGYRNSTEISGKLYFMYKKHLIPMHFVQAHDGALSLLLNGDTFCDKLQIDGKPSGILSTLCNSAVYKNDCTYH